MICDDNNGRFYDVSNIPKNHEDETVNKILIKGSYVPMITIYESCWKHQFYYQQNPLENLSDDSCVHQFLSVINKIYKSFDANPSLEVRDVFWAYLNPLIESGMMVFIN